MPWQIVLTRLSRLGIGRPDWIIVAKFIPSDFDSYHSNLSRRPNSVRHLRPKNVRSVQQIACVYRGSRCTVARGLHAFWLLWLRDVRNDRKHTITVITATPLFVGNGDDDGCHEAQLTTIERGAKLPVRRIRYLKESAAIDVVLPDGRQGYVVLGIGEVSVISPLPTI